MRNKKVFYVRKPEKKAGGGYELIDEGKSEILDALRRCEGRKLSDLNFSGFYTPNARESLAGIFKEMFNDLFNEMADLSKELGEVITSYRKAIENVGDVRIFWERFNDRVDELKEIKLLKPLAQDMFDKAMKEFRETSGKVLESAISSWKSKFDYLRNCFKINMEKEMNRIASATVENIKTQIDFRVKSIEEARSKMVNLDSLRDYQIENDIMSAIEKDTRIRELVDKDKESHEELRESVKEMFRKEKLIQFVNEVNERIKTNKNACADFIETEKIKDEAEKQKKQNEIMNKHLEDLKKQNELALEEERKRGKVIEKNMEDMKNKYEEDARKRDREFEDWKKDIQRKHDNEIDDLKRLLRPLYENIFG